MVSSQNYWCVTSVSYSLPAVKRFLEITGFSCCLLSHFMVHSKGKENQTSFRSTSKMLGLVKRASFLYSNHMARERAINEQIVDLGYWCGHHGSALL